MGDGAIYGICMNVVAMKVEYFFSSESFRDLCGVGVGKVDRATIPRLASAPATDYSHALVGVVDVFGEHFGAIR